MQYVGSYFFVVLSGGSLGHQLVRYYILVCCSGVRGETRSQWSIGDQGATGSSGPTGSAGVPGQSVPYGSTGPSGSKGDTGAIGWTGAVGFTDETEALGLEMPLLMGDTGATGLSGAAGVGGSVGKWLRAMLSGSGNMETLAGTLPDIRVCRKSKIVNRK